MSLLSKEGQQHSNEQRLNATVFQIKSISAKTYSDLVKVQRDGIRSVWNNPSFTPQEIIDALGADAGKIFEFHGKLTDFLIEISAVDNVNYEPALPTHSFVVVDGKITVTDQPYTKS